MLYCKPAVPVKLPFDALPVTWLLPWLGRLAPPAAWNANGVGAQHRAAHGDAGGTAAGLRCLA
jgi:hypothetical protein